jgi:ParB-like chromosome segregation protein Spo0J
MDERLDKNCEKLGIVGIHPIAAMFPVLVGDDFVELCESIKERGVVEPIAVNPEGLLMDGSNRLNAATFVDAEPKATIVDVADESGWIIARNLHRRHLNASQRALSAAKLATMPQGRPRNEKGANLRLNEVSLEQAAKQMDVSPRTVNTANAVLKNAAPEVVEKVERREMTLNAAHKTIKEVQMNFAVVEACVLAEQRAASVRKFKATLRNLKMPAEWDEIEPDSRAGLKRAIVRAIVTLNRLLGTCPEE